MALLQMNKYDSQQNITQYLLDEFMVQSDGHGTTTYYHPRSGQRNVQLMHLLHKAVNDNPYISYHEIEKALQMVKQKMRPIILTNEHYRPSCDSVVNVHGFYYVNLWKQPLVEPADISAQPFVDHLKLMLGTGEKAQWLIQLLALKYQRPLEKPHQAVYLYHAEGGMGKGILVDTLKHVFGSSAVMSLTDGSAFSSGSNIDAWKRTWLTVSEYDVKTGSKQENYLKTMLGDSSFQAPRKNEHFSTHQTPASLIMCSNNPPSFITKTDRRWFVSEFHNDFEDDAARADYMTTYINWLKDVGYSAVANLLKNEDVSGYDLALGPIKTEEWQRCADMRGDEGMEIIANYLEDNPNRTVFTAIELRRLLPFVPQKAVKYKLVGAGLIKEQQRVNFERLGKRDKTQVWIRSGCSLNRLSSGTIVMPMGQPLKDQVILWPHNALTNIDHCEEEEF